MKEKLILAKSRLLVGTASGVFAMRYGNVTAARGSVIFAIRGSFISIQTITITDPQMTRFMMTHRRCG